MLASICALNSCSEVGKEEKAAAQPGAKKEMGKKAEPKEMKKEAEPTKPEQQEMKKEQPKGDDRYIGMEYKAAMEMAKAEGVPARPIEIDGKPMIVTMDYRPERLNFTVVKGKVVKVTRG